MSAPRGGRGSNQYQTKGSSAASARRSDHQILIAALGTDVPIDLRDRMLLHATQWEPPLPDEDVDKVVLHFVGHPGRWNELDDPYDTANSMLLWVSSGFTAGEADEWLNAVPSIEVGGARAAMNDSFAIANPTEVAAWKNQGFSAQEAVDWCRAFGGEEDDVYIACDDMVGETARWFQDEGLTPADVKAGDSLVVACSELYQYRTMGMNAREALSRFRSDQADPSAMHGKRHPVRPDYTWQAAADLGEGDGIRTVNDQGNPYTSELGEPLTIEKVEILDDGSRAFTVVPRNSSALLREMTMGGMNVVGVEGQDIDGYERQVIVMPAEAWVMRR